MTLCSEYRALKATYDSETSDLRQQIAENQSELANQRTQLQGEFGVYQDIIKQVEAGNISGAKLLIEKLNQGSFSELDIQVISYIDKVERMQKLDRTFMQIDREYGLTVRNKIWKILAHGIKGVLLFASVFISAFTLVAIIRGMPDKINRWIATGLSVTCIMLAISSTGTTNMPLYESLFYAMTNSDAGWLSAFFAEPITITFQRIIIPMIVGLCTGRLIKKVIASGNIANSSMMLVIFMSIVTVSLLDTAIFYDQNIASDSPFISNYLFVTSFILMLGFSNLHRNLSPQSKIKSSK